MTVMSFWLRLHFILTRYSFQDLRIQLILRQLIKTILRLEGTALKVLQLGENEHSYATTGITIVYRSRTIV